MKKEDTLAVDMTDEQWFNFRVHRGTLANADESSGDVYETSSGEFRVTNLMIPCEEDIVEEAIADERFGFELLDEVRRLGGHQRRAQQIVRHYYSWENPSLLKRGLLKGLHEELKARPIVRRIRGYRKLSGGEQ